MNIIPITKESPACFGVLCQVHAECARYHAVEQSGEDPYHVIGMCSETQERPLFVRVERVEEA